MKVLLATDGSQLSLDAIEAFVARLSWFSQAPAIELVHVHAAVPYGGAAAWAGKEAVDRYYGEESDAAMKPAIELLHARGVTFHAAKLVGEAAPEIVRHAHASGCDLIVMGTHGHGAMASLVLGSVTTQVVSASKVPVLVLKRPA
jgi:nucleotide-binding universal stress UspA family protein